VPEPSVAAASFADALSLLRSQAIEPAERVVPFAYQAPAWSPAPTVAPPRPPAGGPLAAAVAGQRDGTVSSVDLVESCLRAIDSRDAELAAMVEVHAEEALADAAAADAERAAGEWRGPLHGVPMTVKDIIDVAGFMTRAGSLAYSRLAYDDAPAVAMLRRAGAVIVAKASTHEFALGVTTPQSRNPHDPTRIPGGSSGGSAISVATGMALASLGTDTRASIRVPAALSGVVGIKATHGAVPTAGIVSLSWTMDHVAPMAATVGDAAIVLSVLLGGDFSGARPASGLRVGVPAAAFEGVDPGIVDLVDAALGGLQEVGNLILPVERPDRLDLDVASAAGLGVSRCEAASVHRTLGLDRSLYTDEVGDQLDAADGVLAVDYLDAQRVRGQLAERLLRCFDGADVLAMPTTATTAPLVADAGRHLMRLARNAIPWSFVGFPAISVPAGMVDGLPVGLQIVAPPHREDLLIAAGLAVESWVASSWPAGVAGRQC
jgi:aspartyl-tRNA(Asn)/glutamyl-tRNA(Gln) amidotransferase subunit A